MNEQNNNFGNMNSIEDNIQDNIQNIEDNINYDNIYSMSPNILINKPITKEIQNQKYNFLQNDIMIETLKNLNYILNITQSALNKIIFIYTHPKVGSTSLVTSIRIFASHQYNVIHIHDENMLKRLTNIKNITINDLILYNQYIGKEVYVIDVYRSPIERKISTFFEKIDTLHFNNTCNNLNNYNIEKLINRFNKIYPFIGNGDHFIDTYNINIPDSFDFNNKYIFIKENDITYIKLRLKDSDMWDTILSKLLNVNIKIIKDYETSKKEIKTVYLKFKELYKIPINYLEELDSCIYLNYYYTEKEKAEYFHEWSNKIDKINKPFSIDEYRIYDYISVENKYIEDIQKKHYLDQGCMCRACFIKRSHIQKKIMNGQEIKEEIIHENVKNEYINKQIELYKKMMVKRGKDTKKFDLKMI